VVVGLQDHASAFNNPAGTTTTTTTVAEEPG
jgi:hypothetical protein